MSEERETYWAVAPGARCGWDFAASYEHPDLIPNGYNLWNVNWGTTWGWSPFRWSAISSAKRKARALRKRSLRQDAPKIIGAIGDDDLRREYERIKKELERRGVNKYQS